MSIHSSTIGDLPGALGDDLDQRLADSPPAVFLDYDGTLTPSLDVDDSVPIYVGDDVTDEHAFEALAGRGVGAIVASRDDPEASGRATRADFVLESTEEVERFLDSLAR